MSAFYSDNGVDQLIDPHLPDFGYALEIGANDGRSGSNCKHFEDKGWIVMCVEPNPRLAAAGVQCRKLWKAVACGAQNMDEVQFSVVGPFPFGSFSGLHTHEIPPEINPHHWAPNEVVSVRMETAAFILEHSGFPRLDLLTIDVEGHELEVLKGFDFKKWRPKIIVAEAWCEKNKNDNTSYLAQFDYVLDAQRAYDCCYGRRPL